MQLSKEVIKDLEQLAPGCVSVDVSLAAISRWRIGGKADVIIRPESPDQISSLRRYFYSNRIHHIVIGMTSNLLFSDDGLRVPCIQIDSRLGGSSISEGTVRAQAGAWVPALARKIQQAGLVGAEHFCGIPGSIGGLVYMNGGSQRKAIGESILGVTTIDREGIEHTRTAEECLFGYRRSVFQRIDEVIVQVTMRFEPGCRNTTRKSMLTILKERRRKFPGKSPNCGSVFKSNHEIYSDIGPPGKVIEMLGLKGFRLGGAMISPIHANFIVNCGGAESRDVVSLVKCVKELVLDKTGFNLDSEVIFIDEHGVAMPVSDVK